MYQPIAFTMLSGSLRPVSVKLPANHNLPRKDRPRPEFAESFLAAEKMMMAAHLELELRVKIPAQS